jgi:hypothetical protein
MKPNEFKRLLERYSGKDIIFAKTKRYILDRIGSNEEEVVKDILSTEKLEFVEKQERGNETRYALFFVYSRRKGRVYVLALEENIKIITAYPLGKRTLSKYHKKRFKNSGSLI